MSEAPSTRFSTSFALASKPALAGKSPIRRNGITLEPVFGGYVFHVLARPGDLSTSDTVRGLVAGATALRAVSPGQWFIVGDAPFSENLFQTLTSNLSATADLLDQSHGRPRMRLQGMHAAQVLNKGTAVDLDPARFPIGTSAMTMIGHIGAQITRTEDTRFEIIVLRGFAESLWDDLDHMSREFI